ncbi:3-hydroxyacyl-ACP dehydratase FabZ [Candidatus Neptunochlamydia vexilliferae]|uniref:3-hydroxyacyl-[acyl-carrier-protein] dehydratase FabZ n=1 Tax=Candidatus Neptunichlamydia vexilliferae TaxID=1651774 RepID=A0ABS0AXN6_9BACT|nr:3-hydroxyacyl-ACP dehydratase FabZ [Candidatus Neptunochlamydia vexilliferae]MBF5058888.1 3-hydroxyacyl-[acyl-carrier-protein] dehydratase FabZ [Candidatus Neptunochlamydia vexilliferae]
MSDKVVLNIKQIRDILPHRYPFLLVDRVVELDLENNNIVATKCVTMNEEFFQGHFPQAPIMPGVLILEALAQTGGILIHEKGFKEKTAVLLSVNNVKFRRPALPGDVIMMHVHGLHLSSKGGKVEAKAMVNGELATEAVIGFALTSFEQI